MPEEFSQEIFPGHPATKGLRLLPSPAAAGTVVSLFGTGLGRLSFPRTDEGISVPPFSQAGTSVSVLIGGQSAQVLYAAEAPGLVSGVSQVNVRIPDRVDTAVPVTVQITAGDRASQGKSVLRVSLR